MWGPVKKGFGGYGGFLSRMVLGSCQGGVLGMGRGPVKEGFGVLSRRVLGDREGSCQGGFWGIHREGAPQILVSNPSLPSCSLVE